MKYFLIGASALSSFLITACKETDHKPGEMPGAKKSLPPTEDTFQRVPIYKQPHYKNPQYVQSGFIIDSAVYRVPGSTVSFYFNLPKLSKTEFPGVVKWMNELLVENRTSYKQSQAEWQQEKQKESDVDVFDGFLGTKLLYKDDKILSIVLDAWIVDGMHRSVWSHYAFNYDIEKKKRIYVGDYFMLQSLEDTLFLNHFLRQSVGARPENEFDIRNFEGPVGEHLSFAIDSTNVYFFFDRYDLYGIGDHITIVPKKYIRDHIRSEYR